MPRTCVNSADNFCYVCGEVTFASQKRSITTMVKRAYHLYFGCKIGDQDKRWAPHICCNTCATNLRQWLNRKRKSMPFAVPMIWREPTDHTSNCYFCMLPPVGKGVSKKKKWTVLYPNIPSAIRPVPHGEGLPVPDAPESFSLESEEEEEEDETSGPEPSMSQDPHFLPSSSSEPHLITQGDLNDLVRDLELPKSKAEQLGSRLQQWNLLAAALQAADACPQAALQAADACPQASDVVLHQLKRAVTVCEDMEDTSPLKLRSKKKRLSTNFEKCGVCQENQKNAKLSQATSAGQNSVMLAAEARRDELYWWLLGEFSSLDAVPPILYHKGCFQKYTSKSNLAHVRVMLNPGRKTDSESDQRASCSSESIATGLSTSSSDWSCCIVCLRKTRKKDKKLHRIETFERAANLREAALQRGDADMLRRASVEDLIAKEAVYHATCISSYLSKTNLKAKQSTIQSPYDIAFYQLIEEIDNDLMDNKKALLLSKLLQRYKALLPSEIETASYSSSKLQARLVKHYGSAISFHAQHGQGKSTIILCSAITLTDAIQASSNPKQALKSSKCFLDGLPASEPDDRLSKEQVVLYNAASILRSEIAKMKALEYYPKTGDCNLQRPATFVPQLVQEFVLRLIDKEAHNSVSSGYQPSEDIQRRCRSIAECIVFNSNPCTRHRDHNGEQDSDVD